MKDEIFNTVVAKVTEVTGISRNDMMHSNMESCMDARYILVKALVRLGFSNLETGNLIGRTRQAVGHLSNNYKRIKWTLENDLKAVLKWVENEYLK